MFYPKVYIFETFISETDFTAIKYSGQGSFKVKKEMIDKLLFLLKTIGIYPYTTLTNLSTKYLVMCKVYTDVGGIK